MNNYDCIIVGAGIVGSILFYKLSLLGKKCLLLEKSQLGNGITGHSGCIVRVSHKSEYQCKAAAIGFSFYKELVANAYNSVPFNNTGYLHLSEDFYELTRIKYILEALNIPVKIIDNKEINLMYPNIGINVEHALFEPQSGYMAALPTLQYLVTKGVENGGEYLDFTKTSKYIVNKNNFIEGVITHNGEEFSSSNVILATGNNTPSILKENFNTDLDLWNQYIHVTKFKPNFKLENAPSFIFDDLRLNGRYCPITKSMYIGYPTDRKVDKTFDFENFDLNHSNITLKNARDIFTMLKKSRLSGGLFYSDVYSNSEIGVFGQDPKLPNGLLISTGFSGGGFKMAPFIADELIKLIK